MLGPTNVACCWPTMLRPFAWALSAHVFPDRKMLWPVKNTRKVKAAGLERYGMAHIKQLNAILF